tara:strand:- start:4683 stop:5705 length:1023 start_codon:yes stop_codon:yes gene_type:complete
MYIFIFLLGIIGSAQDLSEGLNIQLSFQYAPKEIMSDGKHWYRFVRSLKPPHKVIAYAYKHSTIEMKVPAELLDEPHKLHLLNRNEQQAYLEDLFQRLGTKTIQYGDRNYSFYRVKVLSPGILCCSNRKANLEGYIALDSLSPYLRIEGVEKTDVILAEDRLAHRSPREDNFTAAAEGSDWYEDLEPTAETDSDQLEISEEDIIEYANSPLVNQMILYGLKVYRDSSLSLCYAYVKQMLSDGGGLISLYPGGSIAYHATKELPKAGFVDLLDNPYYQDLIQEPEQAPRGSVLVYRRRNRPGHIEIRTRDGFLSDYYSSKPITKTKNGALYSLESVFIKKL